MHRAGVKQEVKAAGRREVKVRQAKSHLSENRVQVCSSELIWNVAQCRNIHTALMINPRARFNARGNSRGASVCLEYDSIFHLHVGCRLSAERGNTESIVHCKVVDESERERKTHVGIQHCLRIYTDSQHTPGREDLHTKWRGRRLHVVAKANPHSCLWTLFLSQTTSFPAVALDEAMKICVWEWL